MKKIATTFLLGILFSLTFLVSSTQAATCWFQFTCNQTDPAKIEICSNGKCTIQGGLDAVKPAVKGLMSEKKIEVFVSDTVKYFLTFVSLIAVVYFIYAGFQLMVSGWDEEKAKKTKRIMVYVIAGIILIWVSYFLVAIVINSLT
jgi:Type IV secretion system pilin